VILQALLDVPNLPQMQFQGGTCLRLFYANPRLSEDLDFAVTSFSNMHLGDFADRLDQALDRAYGLKGRVKIPEPNNHSAARHVSVKSWQIVVETALNRSEPSQHIKIDFAEIPSFSREILPLMAPWESFSSAPRVLVPVQSIEEIAADKTLALAVQDKYLRVRDIFDLAFCRQKGATPRKDWVHAKASQYGETVNQDLWNQTTQRVTQHINSGQFAKEMARFLVPNLHDDLMTSDAFLAYCADSVAYFMKAMQDDDQTSPRMDFFS
jgi:predicted nucleotidyltransferase component of viral defense system